VLIIIIIIIVNRILIGTYTMPYPRV